MCEIYEGILCIIETWKGGFSFDRMQAGWSMPSQLHSKFCVVLLPGSPGMLWKRKKTWAYDVPGEMRSYNLTLELVFWVSFPMVIFILEWNERAHAFISVLSRLKHYDPLWSNATEEQSSATSAGWFLSLLPIRPALLWFQWITLHDTCPVSGGKHQTKPIWETNIVSHRDVTSGREACSSCRCARHR